MRSGLPSSSYGRSHKAMAKTAIHPAAMASRRPRPHHRRPGMTANGGESATIDWCKEVGTIAITRERCKSNQGLLSCFLEWAVNVKWLYFRFAKRKRPEAHRGKASTSGRGGGEIHWPRSKP